VEILVGELIIDFFNFYKIDNAREMFEFETGFDVERSGNNIEKKLGFKRGNAPYLIHLIRAIKEGDQPKKGSPLKDV
jgi:hypothetical protein